MRIPVQMLGNRLLIPIIFVYFSSMSSRSVWAAHVRRDDCTTRRLARQKVNEDVHGALRILYNWFTLSVMKYKIKVKLIKYVTGHKTNKFIGKRQEPSAGAAGRSQAVRRQHRGEGHIRGLRHRRLRVHRLPYIRPGTGAGDILQRLPIRRTLLKLYGTS